MDEYTGSVVREHYAAHDVARRYETKYEKGLLRRLSNRQEQRALRALLKTIPWGGKVIDVAAGAGRMLPILIDHFSDVTAADGSEAMLEIVARRFSDQAARIHPMKAEAHRLPVPDASFDGVVSVRLIHHVHERARRVEILAEFARVTRDWAIVSFFSSATAAALRIRVMDRIRGRRSRSRVSLSPAELRGEAAEAGLEWVESRAAAPLFSQHVIVLFRKVPKAVPAAGGR